jgi:hypothetical protein
MKMLANLAMVKAQKGRVGKGQFVGDRKQLGVREQCGLKDG